MASLGRNQGEGLHLHAALPSSPPTQTGKYVAYIENKKKRLCRYSVEWARKDSNLRPRDYESPALTS